jgi:predicted metal-binding membrane protein
MSATLERGPAVTAAYAGRRQLPVAVPLAIALAWAAAVVAHATGVAGRFHHDALLGGGTPSLVGVGGYALAWTVMVTAMMLPSALPLLRLFVETSAGQGRRGWLLACFTAGYLAVWAMFGWAALVFDGGVHGTVDAVGWLAVRPWLVGAAGLGLAGAFQFSSLKDRCLTECRHPAAYLLRHYRRGPRAAFRLGWGHGLYCLGCCWALMLVMFSVGVADLGWMAAMAGLMAYEKLGRHGRGAAIATGVAALALAALVALHPAWMPPVMASHG